MDGADCEETTTSGVTHTDELNAETLLDGESHIFNVNNCNYLMLSTYVSDIRVHN